MRASTFSSIVALAAFTKSVIATPPACLLACVSKVEKASDACDHLNQVSCICENLSSDVESCLTSACPDGDADAAISAFEASCNGKSNSTHSSSASHSASHSASASTNISASLSGSSTSATATGNNNGTSAGSGSGSGSCSGSCSGSSSSSGSGSSSGSSSGSKNASNYTTATFQSQSVNNGMMLGAPAGALVGAAFAIGLLF